MSPSHCIELTILNLLCFRRTSLSNKDKVLQTPELTILSLRPSLRYGSPTLVDLGRSKCPEDNYDREPTLESIPINWSLVCTQERYTGPERISYHHNPINLKNVPPNSEVFGYAFFQITPNVPEKTESESSKHRRDNIS